MHRKKVQNMKPLSENDDHITAQQAKKYASRKTLFNYTQQGKLTLFKDYRGRNIYLESELREVFGTLTLIQEKIDPEAFAKEILRKCAKKLME